MDLIAIALLWFCIYTLLTPTKLGDASKASTVTCCNTLEARAPYSLLTKAIRHSAHTFLIGSVDKTFYFLAMFQFNWGKKE